MSDMISAVLLGVRPSDATHILTVHMDHWWIVFFAPSAAVTALPSLSRWFEIDPGSASQLPHKRVRGARLAAIGPTTAASMWDELHLRVDVVSAKPTPSDVVGAVVAYDRGKIQGMIAEAPKHQD